MLFPISDALAAGEAASAGGMESFLVQVVPLIVIRSVLVLPDPSAAEASKGARQDVRRARQG